jgi:hypothetical protein
VLCYEEGLTRDEAALRLGLPPATVKTRLERGRRRLGEALTRRGCVAGAGLLALAATSPAGASPPHLVESFLAVAAGRVPASVAALAGVGAESALVNRSLAALVVLAGTAALGLGLVSAGLPATAPPQGPRPGKADEPAVAGAMPGPAAKAADAPQVPADQPAARRVSGRVVGPDGKPAAGAKLFVPVTKVTLLTSIDDVAFRLAGTADADGRFAVAAAPFHKDFPVSYVIAYAPGFGVDWLQFGKPGDPEPVGEQTLRLPKDVAITGQVVSTEGRPLPGLTVSAVAVYMPAGDKLDEYLAGWKKDVRNNLATPKKRLHVPLSAITGPTTTDRDGRFTVRGAGVERIVELRIAGDGVARSMPWVITRPGFDPKPYNEELLKKGNDDLRVLNRFLGLYAPEFTFVAEPGKEITGVVSDSATGEPVAKCGVSTQTGYGDGVFSLTDSRGFYRLSGVPKMGRANRVSVRPPEGSSYLPREQEVVGTAGLAPVRLDVRLAKGAVVSGRVVDRQTGKGLRAGVRFAPLPGNKLFGTKPEYSAYAHDRTMQETEKDGRFRLVTLPGPALIVGQVQDGETYNGNYLSPYRRATPDPDHKDMFRRADDSWTVATAGGTEFLRTEHIAKVIDIKDSGETEVELFIDRGVTGKVTVQDADGRPLAGAWAAGLTDHWPITYRLTEPTATVYALDPTKPRALAFYHPDKRLGGTVTVRGDEKEPVVAKLGPLARLTGRLLDTDGQPLAGMTVSLNHPHEIDSELYRFAAPAGARAVTGKDGRFTLDAVVPGVWFDLQIRKGKDYYRARPTVWRRQPKPGQAIDLGDRTVAPNQ